MSRNKGIPTMIKQMKMGLIALVGVAIWGLTPGVVHAAPAHTQTCNGCHRLPGADPRGMTNLCTNCHITSNIEAPAKFAAGDASNAMGNNLGAVGNSSHNWGGFTSFKPAAGSTYPQTTFYFSKHSISTKRVTCSICHDPHLDKSPNVLLRVAAAGDLICQKCHANWFISNLPDVNATQTHPIVADYATFAAAHPNDYKATPSNAGNGGVGDARLVEGNVSCTSCHGTHYTDSDATTADGVLNQTSLVPGDGHLLRSDGPLRTGVTRNGAAGTAQLRSNLCQSCHKIELHGQGVSGDHMIGCLDCHGGHAYNGGTPNAYILNAQTPDAVPMRIDGVNSVLPVQVTFANYPNGGSTRTKWADETVDGINGYCERCHGDVNSAAMVINAAEHGVGNTNECTTCHKHNDPADHFSFNRDASAATCGQCHGFPPYLNSPGDRPPLPGTGIDGGYGVNKSGDANTPYDYVGSTNYEKNETQTGHQVHAGRDIPDSSDVPPGPGPLDSDPGDWYFVGISGIDNCRVCHGPNASKVAGGHREAPLTRPGTFRDVPFDGIAKTGGMNPTYLGAAPWTCSNVYCHTNGAPYSGASRPTRDYSVTHVTPAWDQANGGGFNAIYGNANRCQFCHGNNATSMGAGDKQNSPAHQAHLGAATTLNMGKVFDCKICHINTASSPSALAAGAMDGRSGGKHVNGLIDVDFETGTTPNTLPYDLTGSTYSNATGVCSTYCHNVTGDAGAMAADWDVATDMQCDSCHGGLATDLAPGFGPVSSGSHARHVTDANGPQLACSKCHGITGNADLGTHDGHLDGSTINAASLKVGVCTTCHAVDAGETVPTWGFSGTRDCKTCHTGLTTTASGQVGATAAPVKGSALTAGHTRPVASGAYTSGNNAADQQCTVCHSTAGPGHLDATKGDKMLTASGSDCLVCHGPTGSAVNKNMKPHMGKACVACHDPHGSSNLEMIHSTSATQNAKDLSATGKFAADVDFTQRTGVAGSFDEVGSAAGANNDDLCATCHTFALGTSHNNRDGIGSHGDASTHEGDDCLTCHAAHNASGGNAFIAAGGTACNQCHGNPPATGAHRNGTLIEDAEIHSITGVNITAEPRDDCARCHLGADSYTYDPTFDRSVPGGSLNHSNKAGRRTILAGTVGYQKDVSNKWFCASACHNASAIDGFWYTWDGSNETILAKDRTPADTSLNCNACHYQSTVPAPTRAGNVAAGSKGLSATHNMHFDKVKICASCHVLPSDTSHITTSGVTNLDKISGRAQALQDEATVDFSSQTTKYTIDGANTCSNTANNGLGCHATGSPTWGTIGPLACTACHTNKTTSAVNPISGLHSVTPLVSGKQHDESFTYNAGANTADCITCHSSTPTILATDHQNGTLDATRGAAGNTKIKIAATIGYIDGVAPTCAPSLTGCHYEQPTKTTDWKRKWHEGAADPVNACAGCHGDWHSGWNTNVTHHTNAKAQSTHGAKGGKTYECFDCHSLESTIVAYPFTIGSNDWRQNAGESTTLHGNGAINVNDSNTGFNRVGPISGCPQCHTNWQTDGKHSYTTTEWPLATISGDAPTVTCYTCHGGQNVGTAEANYWPDKANDYLGGGNASEDHIGRHQIHMEKLAMAQYGETISQLLDDPSSDTKQRALCAFCHTAPAADDDHSNTLPAEVFIGNVATVATRSSKTLWGTADGDATYNSGNCSNVDCHNGKATATTATFDWYGIGTRNCAVCHNDITVTTAGTTGATHQAHLAAPTFGKVMTCSNCHGGTPAWSPYTVPSLNHINGTFKLEGGSVIDGTVKTYNGTYTNAATRTPGTCGTNACHNNGKNAAAAAYTWQTAITGCTACHATSATLGSSHDPHLNAGFATTFGRTAVGCGECHDAVSASDMTAKTSHIDGSVNLKAGITYTGNLSVATAASYGACSASACHQTGKGVNVNSPAWNRLVSSTDNCTICHNNGATQPNPATGRHNKHVANTAYVTLSCGSCHANATATTIGGTTHINASANTGVNILTHTAGAADCTNNCHVVNAATNGDWLDAAVLACTECHTTGKIAATAGALPASGLHAVTPRVSGKKHDQTLNVANGCEFCHTTIRAATTTHIKGNFVVDGAANTDRGLFATYSEAATGSCTGTGVNLAAGCHRDNGKWGRKWTTTVTANDGSECANCHGGIGVGYAATTWSSGIAPDHTADWDVSGTPKVMTSHSVCKTCHGFAGAASKDANYDLTNLWNIGGADTSMHGNSKITMNGGTNYIETNFGCDNAGCHGNAATGKHLADSGLTVELGSFAAGGSCFGCHGNGSTQYWPDDLTNTTYPDRAGKHEEHVVHIAEKMAGGLTLANENATCIYCHAGTPGEPGHSDNVIPANVVNTDANNDDTPETDTAYKFKRLVDPLGKGADTAGFWRPTPGTCSKVACHASALFTPHWYTDTVLPAPVSNLAYTAGTVPGTVKLSWTTVGDDNNLDGTAYRYDIRYRKQSDGAIDATNFATTSSEVGNIPSPLYKGKPQSLTVEGLTPGQNYYFALKTYDVTGNPSTISNIVGPVTAKADTTAPVFYGIETAVVGDEHGQVRLTWNPAIDHSLPVTYKVWWSNSTIDYGAVPNATTQGRSLLINGLTPGDLNYFAVRAMDNAGVTDSNPFQKQLLVKPSTEHSTSLKQYFSNTARTGTGPYLLTMGTAYASAATTDQAVATGTSMTWFADASTQYAVDMNVSGLYFEVYIGETARLAGQKVTTELGYGDGTTFTALAGGTAASTTIGKRSARVRKLPINTYSGRIPAGKRVAVRVNNTGAGSLGFRYGNSTYKGLLTLNEQLYNHLPGVDANLNPVGFTLNQPSGSGLVNLSWSAPTDIDSGDVAHYDVYGSDDNGNTWKYIIATNLATPGITWDTRKSGIALATSNSLVKVMVDAGDGYASGDGTGASHFEQQSAAWTVNNTVDNVPPAAVTDLEVETRPKTGAAYLTWTATGDDGNDGRAAVYDVRYSLSNITNDSQFSAATRAAFTPPPKFSGGKDHYELLGLNPDVTYYFAIKVGDEAATPNWSPLSDNDSVTVGYQNPSTQAGPECGICHATPPDGGSTAGNHIIHGYTLADCAKCHGSAVDSYLPDHQDGLLKFGWGPSGPSQANIVGNTVTYTDGVTVIYQDTSGDATDNGTCSGWTTLGVGGCHGPASPQWIEGTTLLCSACHGISNRTTDSIYSRQFDATIANAGVVPDQIKASPPIDNHGYDGTGATEATTKYVGQHEKHLNYSFRMSKGDSCATCHGQGYVTKNNLPAAHADGLPTIDIDLAVAGVNAKWIPGTATTASSCSDMSELNCHPKDILAGGTAPTPKWDKNQTFACNNCHGFNSVNPSHIKDLSTDRACIYCHPGGHPAQTTQEPNAIMIPNNPAVGIDYRSGGIHLWKVIGGRSTMNDTTTITYEAQVCWGCHEDNSISEWGADGGPINVDDVRDTASKNDYNFGTLSKTSWVGASWSSGTTQFSYKTGAIQSTHTANSNGSSAVTGTAYNYTEASDSVDLIRCSYCHDVHNRNLAPNDTLSGAPFLRGSWKSNPYAEDGAPQTTTTYVNVPVGSYGFGAVPRGGTGYTRQGGYYIDQNNVVPQTKATAANGTFSSYPTANWTMQNSAGLCILCHGSDVDRMDRPGAENLWVGTNGHSNAVVGGTADSAIVANIFGDGVGGRPIPTTTTGSLNTTGHVPNMANQAINMVSIGAYAYSYRGSAASGFAPLTLSSQNRDHNAFNWGVTADPTTIDVMYHQFSCSKCHNPHASRLPKLMITNCLDVQKNQWDSARAMQSKWTSATLTNVDRKSTGTTHMRTAYYASAQTCHRYTRPETSYAPAASGGGWNNVTPWNGAY